MIRRRVKKQHFTQINNDTLRNPVLSLKAKGLLAVMMIGLMIRRLAKISS